MYIYHMKSNICILEIRDPNNESTRWPELDCIYNFRTGHWEYLSSVYNFPWLKKWKTKEAQFREYQYTAESPMRDFTQKLLRLLCVELCSVGLGQFYNVHDSLLSTSSHRWVDNELKKRGVPILNLETDSGHRDAVIPTHSKLWLLTFENNESLKSIQQILDSVDSGDLMCIENLLSSSECGHYFSNSRTYSYSPIVSNE